MKLSTGILAGRHSDGLNDARVRAGNRSVIKKLTAELSPLGEVVISAADRKDYEDLAERVFADSSPLEGIYNIVKAAGTEWVLICGADVPMVSRELAEYMAGYISADYDCVCVAFRNPGVFLHANVLDEDVVRLLATQEKGDK